MYMVLGSCLALMKVEYKLQQNVTLPWTEGNQLSQEFTKYIGMLLVAK
jgi:hypothetical protein